MINISREETEAIYNRLGLGLAFGELGQFKNALEELCIHADITPDFETLIKNIEKSNLTLCEDNRIDETKEASQLSVDAKYLRYDDNRKIILIPILPKIIIATIKRVSSIEPFYANWNPKEPIEIFYLEKMDLDIGLARTSNTILVCTYGLNAKGFSIQDDHCQYIQNEQARLYERVVAEVEI